MKAWSGRFSKETNNLVEKFNASIGFDYVLAPYDIIGSLAHVNALLEAEIIDRTEASSLINGLKSIYCKFQTNKIEWSIHDEDIHMNIEHLLHEEIGDTAHKLHTGRSRNDQVSLDLHLYCRASIVEIGQNLLTCQEVMIHLAKQHINSCLPGYTHLQRAQPVRLAHHLLAYVAMWQRDFLRLKQSWQEVNICPLGAGALAGSGFPLNRAFSATLLGFDTCYQNSMDAVSNRDFALSLLSNIALCGQHLSRLAEELVLWNSQEFNFISFDDAFCTGSSMMPQKKNPDIPELIRGKTGRLYGNLVSLLTTLKALPLSYNKDLQEDKMPLFDSVNTITESLGILPSLLSSISFNVTKMEAAIEEDFSEATFIADFLVMKQIPFRVAHEIVGKMVKCCLENNQALSNLSKEELETFHPALKSLPPLNLEHVLEHHQVMGGTAKNQVLNQIQSLSAELNQQKTWIDNKDKLLEKTTAALLT